MKDKICKYFWFTGASQEQTGLSSARNGKHVTVQWTKIVTNIVFEIQDLMKFIEIDLLVDT